MGPMTYEELRTRYAGMYGVAAEYLPSNLDGVLEWQTRLMADVTSAGKFGAAQDAPSVAALRALLARESTLAAHVNQMIEEQFQIIGHGTPPISTVDQMLACMNYIITRAPSFEADPAKRNFFPMSSLFVFMMYTPTGWVVFRNTDFNDAIRRILQAWCDYLDSPASLNVINKTPTGWLSPAAAKLMDLKDFVIPDPGAEHGGFASFNAYFHRQIKLESRPLAGRQIGMTVVSANDGTIFRIARKVQKTADIWSKDEPYSLELMLDGIDEPGCSVDDFVNGDVFQSFLSGANCHRWRAPVSGTIVAQRKVDGLMFSELRAEGFDPNAGPLSQGYQASVNTRGLTFIKADWGPLKTVCVMPIGITEISSINFCREVGEHVDKGDELGWFSYGGSTLCLIFQPGAIMQFNWPWPPEDPKNPPKIQVRSQIATANPYRAAATSTDVIAELITKLEEDPDLAKQLTESLQLAKTVASAELEPALFKALSWPVSEQEYVTYLREFAQWIPRQSRDEAWTAPGTDEQQEVYDRLCHFYWLIDQKIGVDGKMVENNEWFSKWLIAYADVWGSFLNTTESFNQEVLDSFINDSPEYRVQDSMVDNRPNSPSGWLTFNQFFARELNPGLRPIASPTDNSVITSPADCTYRNMFVIGPDSTIPEITIKKTHKFASIKDLLEGSPYADAFANGTFIHYFLGPYSYHRFHTPVAGLLRECRAVKGLVYLDVNLSGNQFDAPDSAKGGYEFAQARGILTIDTTGSAFGNVGIVAVIPVGMCQVSSVNMTAIVGNNMLKGEEFGYFLFGGSDIIVLLQEGTNPKVYTSNQYRHYGTTIATCSKR